MDAADIFLYRVIFISSTFQMNQKIAFPFYLFSKIWWFTHILKSFPKLRELAIILFSTYYKPLKAEMCVLKNPIRSCSISYGRAFEKEMD